MTEVEISILIKNYITVIGVILAGGWALWKWEFSKYLKAKNNIYSIDGELLISTKYGKDTKTLTKLTGIWRNRGEVNIELEPKLIQIYVYELKDSLELGEINFNDSFGEPKYRIYPFNKLSKLTLGSNTESLMEQYFMLKENRRYAISWKLYKKSKKKNDPSFFIERGIIFDTFSEYKKDNFDHD